jgi:hypothetical protein
VCLAVGAVAASARGDEVVLQHDMLSDASDGTPLLAFIAGDMAAAWYEAPSDGTIVGVQIVWGSTFGGASDSTEYAIHIFEAGTFPDPDSATPLASISAPELVDGTSSGNINEFRFLDPPDNDTPLSVFVSEGDEFIVALEFQNENDGQTFLASVKYDDEDCIDGTSAAYTESAGWGDACTLGVPGNLGIRAIFMPVPEPTTLALLVLGALLASRLVPWHR